MTESIEPTHELTATAEAPEVYVRIGHTKTAKEWRHETTVSIRWPNHWWTSDTLMHVGENRTEFLIAVPPAPDSRNLGTLESSMDRLFGRLLAEVDRIGRAEAQRREALDAEKAAATP